MEDESTKNGDVINLEKYQNVAIKLEEYYFYLYNTINHSKASEVDEVFLVETGVHIDRIINDDDLTIYGHLVVKDVDKLMIWIMRKE